MPVMFSDLVVNLSGIEVLEDALRIEVSLPWLLAKVANLFLPALRKGTVLLLEKK